MNKMRCHSPTIIYMVLLFGGLLTGCSNTTRHEVLTFFFTGVPAPGQAPGAAQGGEVANVNKPAATRPADSKKIQEPPIFTHGPFGSGQCGNCHALAASKPFRTARTEPADTAASEQRNIGPRLAYPLEELCATCHTDKSSAVATAEGLWMHGPVGNGWCTTCHNPHKSTRQYMLLKNNTIELCTECHDQGDLLNTPAHSAEQALDCMSCHNPHLGKDSFMLRSAYDEWQRYNAAE